MLNRLLVALARLPRIAAVIDVREQRAVGLAFSCFFMLMTSYYILRPLRDTMATVFGVEQLQNLFTWTFVVTLALSPVYAGLASRLKLARFLPGVFWFLLANILVFFVLFEQAPQSRLVAGCYFVWFSVVNLFIISVFWSLMVDLFSSGQATRLFALVAAGGSIGAIFGPVITRLLVSVVGIGGLLLVAAGGFLLVIILLHRLMREKERIRSAMADAQRSTLDHALSGNPFEGFSSVFKSSLLLNQAAFMLLMTWVQTIIYFLQTDLVTRTFSDIEQRAQAIADISLVVNILSAGVLIFGMGHFVRRFGVTSGLLLTPLIMVASFLALAVSPTLLVIQAVQVLRSMSQYAIARPCREMCFTVVAQRNRYKAKNVIDTVVYRLGDLTSAWMQAGLRAAGFGMTVTVSLGLASCAVWGVVSVALGRRYERLRHHV
jgi:AAA family ATP:ADP antiporter